MFERFSDEARSVVAFAQEEARLLEDGQIGTEHLLLALLHDGEMADAIHAAGVMLPVARDAVAATERPRAQRDAGKDAGAQATGHFLPFTGPARRALEESLHVARRLGQDRATGPHLVLGLLAEDQSTGVQVLADLGVDLDALAAYATSFLMAGESSVRRMSGFADPVQRLAEGLRRYGRHDADCDPAHGCTCGLSALLAGR